MGTETTNYTDRWERKELPPPGHLFVEIGPHDNLSVPFIGKRQFSNTDFYLAVEKDPKLAKRVQRSLNWVKDRVGTNNLFSVEGDARKMEFLGDQTVDEIYLGNVFGDTENTFNPETFFPEIKRVLKPNGKFTIKETTTPFDLKSLKALLSKYGFVIEKITKITDDNWQEEVSEYDNSALSKKGILLDLPDGEKCYLVTAGLAEKNE